MKRPIIHIIDPDRPFPYGGDTDPINRSDAVSAAVLRVARGLSERFECHLFQKVRTLSQVSDSGLMLHGVGALPHESANRPYATVLVGAPDLLPVVRRMHPDSKLILWMMAPPGDRWSGPARLRERFDAFVVTDSQELALELADPPAIEGPASGLIRPREPAEIIVMEGPDSSRAPATGGVADGTEDPTSRTADAKVVSWLELLGSPETD